jgi:hypothetical protein
MRYLPNVGKIGTARLTNLIAAISDGKLLNKIKVFDGDILLF